MIPLLVTVFIDSLGFGLVFPIFSPLIVGNETGMFGPDVSIAMRGFLFGLLVSVFCLGTFFGGPLLGALSDRKGRKNVLILSVWIAFIGYLLAFVGVIEKSVGLLFLSRIMSGMAGGNYGVAQSVVADTSKDVEKGKNFGLMGMAWGTGFIIGPYLGGKCAQWGLAVPFLAAALVCLINIALLVWRLQETRAVLGKGEFSWGIAQLKRAFESGRMRGLFLVTFLLYLGWGFFTEFSPIFLMKSLSFDLEQIANYYAWVGIWIALSQGWLIRPLLKRFPSHQLLAGSLLALGGVIPLMLLCGPGFEVFAVIPLIAYAEAFVTPTSTTLVSNLTSPDRQGEMLGVLNSVQAAAIGLAPLFSGSLVALYPWLSVVIGSGTMLLAFSVLLVVLRKIKFSVDSADGVKK